MNELYKNIKVVILVPAPLTKRWADYFCTENLYKIFDLEFWDCSRISDPSFAGSSPINASYVNVIKSFNDFACKVSSLRKDTLVLTEVQLIKSNYNIYKILSKKVPFLIDIDFWTFNIENALIERPPIEKNQINSWFDYILKYYNPKSVLKLIYMFFRFYEKSHRATFFQRRSDQMDYDILCLYEQKCVNLFKKKYRISWDSKEKYHIHHPDYQKYLEIRSTKEKCERYIVYMDQYLFFHPDFDLCGYNFDKHTLAKTFYRSLNRYFDFVESEYNCSVIVAAHPSSNYLNNPFNGRKIIYYHTAELIRDSIAVCGHYSNAITFVVLFNKPYSILYSKELDFAGESGILVRKFSKMLCVNLVDISLTDKYKVPFSMIKDSIRKTLINKLVGNVAKINTNNTDLFVDIFNRIHQDICCQLTLKINSQC